MNYKKIFKSQRLRFAILKALSFLPDSVMLRLQYWIKMGRMLNLNDPKRFTEKVQLYKMKYRNEVMFTCVDKYHVREYVESKGLGGILNTLYGVYDDPDQIDFNKLPEQFVIKTTDGSGGQNVFICKDKSTVDWSTTSKELVSWKDKKNIDAGREWAYTGMAKSQYIVEEYLDSDENEGGLVDYKFFCFNGKVFCVQVDYDRFINHKRLIFDANYNVLGVKCTYDDSLIGINNIQLTDEIKRVAELLSKDFPFVRVDLYNINGKIYFGELTFYPGSGHESYTPDTFDFTLGEQFDISSFHKTK